MNIQVGDLVIVENRTFSNEVMPPLANGIVEEIHEPLLPEFPHGMITVSYERGRTTVTRSFLPHNVVSKMPYYEGEKDYKKGLDIIRDNPYPACSRENRDWGKGWLDRAQREEKSYCDRMDAKARRFYE